jgi:hypothetical protein
MFHDDIPLYRILNIEWKIRMNRELEEMSKGENIVKWIKGKTIRHYGGGIIVIFWLLRATKRGRGMKLP